MNNVVDGEFGKNEMTLARAAELAKEEIDNIEAEQAKIDALAEEYKTKAAPHRDQIASLKKDIKDEYGIETKTLATVITKRRQERRMLARIEALSETQREQFDQIEMQFDKAAA